MFIDAQNLFSDAQALTTTAASTNLVDLSADRDIGKGEPMVVVLSLDVATDGTTGDETYSVDLETDDNASFSSPAVLSTTAVARSLAAGTQFVIAVPATNERYLRLNYTLGGTTPTATVTAFLTAASMVQNFVAYPDAITIS